MLALASLIFFSTCGGAFGLEPLIGAIGAGRGLLLILIAPLLWSLPIALMVAELAGRLPEEGGYYIWIRETLGKFWGVQAGCWAITYALGQMAIFPVLFVSYLSYFFPSLGVAADGAHPVLGPLLRWLVALGMITSSLVVNLRSARDVGQTAKVSAALVLGVFAVMILVWLKRTADATVVISVVRNDFAVAHNGALLLVLSILAFNYSGWDSASTYAGEVDEPQRNYPRAIGIALTVLVCCYLLPVLAGVAATTDATAWKRYGGMAGDCASDRREMARRVTGWSRTRFDLGFVQRAASICLAIAVRDGKGWLAAAGAGARITADRDAEIGHGDVLRDHRIVCADFVWRIGGNTVPGVRGGGDAGVAGAGTPARAAIRGQPEFSGARRVGGTGVCVCSPDSVRDASAVCRRAGLESVSNGFGGGGKRGAGWGRRVPGEKEGRDGIIKRAAFVPGLRDGPIHHSDS
jgi:hypothetical protein